MKKQSIKYQLIRDKEIYPTVYDTITEAMTIGELLQKCGWIAECRVIPIKAIWLKA